MRFLVAEGCRLEGQEQGSNPITAGLQHLQRICHSRAQPAAPFASLSTAWQARQQPQPVFELARAADLALDPQQLRLRIVTIKGDGRCMFRAIAKGLMRNKGKYLQPEQEEQEADLLRMAVFDALCRSQKRQKEFKGAVIAAGAEGDMPKYCERLKEPDFWGGQPELLVLSQMIQVPIFVYKLEDQKAQNSLDSLRPYVAFGEEYARGGKGKQPRRPVRLLYRNGNHYDLLMHPQQPSSRTPRLPAMVAPTMPLVGYKDTRPRLYEACRVSRPCVFFPRLDTATTFGQELGLSFKLGDEEATVSLTGAGMQMFEFDGEVELKTTVLSTSEEPAALELTIFSRTNKQQRLDGVVFVKPTTHWAMHREALRGDKSTSPVDVTFLTRWARLEREDEDPATAVGYPAVGYAPAPIWTRPSPRATMESIGAPRGLPLGRSKRGYASAYATAGGVPAPEGKLGEWVSVAPGGLVGSKTFYSRDQPGAGRTCRRELFTAVEDRPVVVARTEVVREHRYFEQVMPGGELVMSEGLCCGELARQAAAAKLNTSERGWQGLDWWDVHCARTQLTEEQSKLRTPAVDLRSQALPLSCSGLVQPLLTEEYVTEVRWTGRERLVQADRQGAEVLDISERLLDREEPDPCAALEEGAGVCLPERRAAAPIAAGYSRQTLY